MKFKRHFLFCDYFLKKYKAILLSKMENTIYFSPSLLEYLIANILNSRIKDNNNNLITVIATSDNW